MGCAGQASTSNAHLRNRTRPRRRARSCRTRVYPHASRRAAIAHVALSARPRVISRSSKNETCQVAYLVLPASYPFLGSIYASNVPPPASHRHNPTFLQASQLGVSRCFTGIITPMAPCAPCAPAFAKWRLLHIPFCTSTGLTPAPGQPEGRLHHCCRRLAQLSSHPRASEGGCGPRRFRGILMRPARHGLQGGLTRRNGWRWKGRGCRGVSRRTDRRFRCGWSFSTVCVADSWFHTYALLGMPCSILHSNESDSWRAGNVVTGCLGWNIPVTPWPPHEQKQPAREAWWRGEACKRITSPSIGGVRLWFTLLTEEAHLCPVVPHPGAI